MAINLLEIDAQVKKYVSGTRHDNLMDTIIQHRRQHYLHHLGRKIDHHHEDWALKKRTAYLNLLKHAIRYPKELTVLFFQDDEADVPASTCLRFLMKSELIPNEIDFNCWHDGDMDLDAIFVSMLLLTERCVSCYMKEEPCSTEQHPPSTFRQDIIIPAIAIVDKIMRGQYYSLALTIKEGVVTLMGRGISHEERLMTAKLYPDNRLYL